MKEHVMICLFFEHLPLHLSPLPSFSITVLQRRCLRVFELCRRHLQQQQRPRSLFRLRSRHLFQQRSEQVSRATINSLLLFCRRHFPIVHHFSHFFLLIFRQIKLRGLPRGPVFVLHSRVYMCCLRRRPVSIAACPKRMPELRLGFLRCLERHLHVHRLPGGPVQRRRGLGVCGLRSGLRGHRGSVFFLFPL